MTDTTRQVLTLEIQKALRIQIELTGLIENEDIENPAFTHVTFASEHLRLAEQELQMAIENGR